MTSHLTEVNHMQHISDLRIHSTASDGSVCLRTASPNGMKRGLYVLALTDHDTMNGLAEKVQAWKIMRHSCRTGY